MKNSLQKNIEINIQEAKRLYNPLTAFGNKELLKHIRRLEELALQQEEAKDCNRCDEDGFVEENCGECNGIGTTMFKCDHEVL